MEVEDLLTVGEAARRLKIKERAVRHLIRSKKLPARKVGPAYVVTRQDLEGLRSNGSQHQDLQEELRELYEQCRGENWDGYGARAVSDRSYREALRFCELLPACLPTPEVGADPDGDIALEWNTDATHVFSISVSPSQHLSYAGLFGQNRVHGVEHFGTGFPQAILDNLSRLVAMDDA